MAAIRVSAREGYGLWADSWDSTQSPIVALEHRMLLPWIERTRTGRALDVGCGTGRWTGQLGAIGLDASREMLECARAKSGLRGRLAVADATALPIADGAADLVLCALTLGHIRDQGAAMREFARILAPAGTLLLTDLQPAAAAAGWRRTFRREGSVFELENHPYTVEGLHCDGLVLEERVDAMIGDPERGLFDTAGRPKLFADACQIPAVLLTRWTRV